MSQHPKKSQRLVCSMFDIFHNHHHEATTSRSQMQDGSMNGFEDHEFASNTNSDSSHTSEDDNGDSDNESHESSDDSHEKSGRFGKRSQATLYRR
ncbi:OLC1v1030299C1 [Oldenlandia corymbosa var. corymbosa]|uniref:OLC1v1030299C1 n=1 Tax=Oldenlandia corymbosa var. corymbosa TaxID=529605 RepID=A0AAV1CIR7_OLDCO|nr:OLC1v1030299C1 [Oldenlandia corymbosa var. corymbosa]